MTIATEGLGTTLKNLEAGGGGGAITLEGVLQNGEDAGGLQIKNVGFATDDSDVVVSLQLQQALDNYSPDTNSISLAQLTDETRAAIGSGLATPPTVLYVSGAAGLDTNTGTLASPLATVDRALQLIGTVRASCTINVMAPSPLSTGYTLNELKRPRPWGPGNRVVTIKSDITQDVVVTATVASSTFQTVTLTTSPATHAYKGMAVRVTSGAQSGQIRAVLNNTAGVLTLMSGFAANLVAGVTLELFYPGVTYDFREVIYGGPDPYNVIKFENCELKFDFCQALGYLHFTGCTIQKPASTVELAFFGGGAQCDTLRGLNWRSTQANGSVGVIDFVGTRMGRISGVLGNVHTHNCARAGYGGALNIAGGELHLYMSNSRGIFTVPIAYQSTRPNLYLTDYGIAPSGNPSPCWINQSFLEVYMPIVLGGTGTSAGFLTARTNAFVEIGVAIASGTQVNVDQMSGVRIASGNNGGAVAWVCEGTDVSTVGVNFSAVGHSATGENGSLIYRSS